MTFTDYYKFVKLSNGTKHRIDCLESTKSYEPLEEKRARASKKGCCKVGDLFCYFGDRPDTFGGDSKRQAEKVLSKSNNISSIYIPEINGSIGYGDMRDSCDALVFVLQDVAELNGALVEGSTIEIFIARGQSKCKEALYNLVMDGMLNDEMQSLRDAAEPETIESRMI